MREKAPCSLYSWFPYPYRFISLCGTTASLNTVEFFNIIGFCSCCHVPLSGVSIVFGWPSWRACFLVCLFVFVCGCVVLRRKKLERRKVLNARKPPGVVFGQTRQITLLRLGMQIFGCPAIRFCFLGSQLFSMDPQPRSMTPAPKTSHLSGREDKQADRSGSSSIVLTVRVVRRYLASLTM